MPRHQQGTTCRKSGGPLSKTCTCEHCTLMVCVICGAFEGGLTTDCPGSRVAFERQKEVYETNLDYTDERGWHLLSEPTKRSPRFESAKRPPEPPRVDQRAIRAPSINWIAVDRVAYLQHELAQRGIAWALAEREDEEHSAKLTRLEDEVEAALPPKEARAAITGNVELRTPDEHAKELLTQLEYAKIGFQLANQHAEKCIDEFRQAARTLVAALEEGQAAAVATDRLLFKRTCGCTVIGGDACPHFVAGHGGIGAAKDRAR